MKKSNLLGFEIIPSAITIFIHNKSPSFSVSDIIWSVSNIETGILFFASAFSNSNRVNPDN